LWRHRVGGRLDSRRRGPSVHGHRRRAAGILRRNTQRRSTGSVDSAAARAVAQRRQRALASAGLRVAARHWETASGRLGRGHGAAPHRHPAAVDAVRVGIPGQLDARRDPHAAQAGDQRRSCRRRRWCNERRVRTQSADPARGLRARVADCLRECREFAARARGRAARANGRASRRGRHATANRDAGARGSRLARGGRRAGWTAGGHGRRETPPFARLHERTVPTHQHTALADHPCVRVRAGVGDRHHFSARRLPGSRRARTRSTRYAGRVAAPAITRRLRGKRC
jgi:hypothetical protein